MYTIDAGDERCSAMPPMRTLSSDSKTRTLRSASITYGPMTMTFAAGIIRRFAYVLLCDAMRRWLIVSSIS